MILSTFASYALRSRQLLTVDSHSLKRVLETAWKFTVKAGLALLCAPVVVLLPAIGLLWLCKWFHEGTFAETGAEQATAAAPKVEQVLIHEQEQQALLREMGTDVYRF